MAWSSEQLRNAATIMAVGRSLGASSRDILIALMVGLQESTLRNLSWGDRDSVGVFQQRAGWGSFSQRTNVATSARMFFTGGLRGPGTPGLLDIGGRNSMSLTRAAQAVQRSGFPNAYAKWQDEAQRLSRSGGGGGAVRYGTSGFVRPVRSGSITQKFGVPNSRYAAGHHTGIDFGVAYGTPVYSAGAGKVVRVTSGGAYGTRVEIEHGGKIWTLYAHLSRANVRVGERVGPQTMIGRSGSTGASSGPHLHFEVRKGSNRYGSTVNPMGYFNGSTTPGAYVEPGGLAGETRVVAATMADLLSQQVTEAAEEQVFKPYVYMSPIDAMTGSFIGTESSDPMAGLGAAEPVPELTPPSELTSVEQTRLDPLVAGRL